MGNAMRTIWVLLALVAVAEIVREYEYERHHPFDNCDWADARFCAKDKLANAPGMDGATDGHGRGAESRQPN
jgi:hypothetical protein